MSDNSQRKSLQLPALTKRTKNSSEANIKSVSRTDLPKLSLPKLNSKSSAEIPKVESDDAEFAKTEMNNPIIEQEAQESVSVQKSDTEKPRKSMSLPSLPKLSMSKPSSDSSEENESPKKELRKQSAAPAPEPVKEEKVKEEKKSLPSAKALKSPKKQPLVVVKDLPPVSADDPNEPHEVPKYYIQNPSMKDEEAVVLPPMPPELGLDDEIGNAPTLINDPSYESSQSVEQIDNALDQLGRRPSVPRIPVRLPAGKSRARLPDHLPKAVPCRNTA